MTANMPPGHRWSILELGLVLYPFAAGAAAVNLFFLGLLGRAVGGPDVTPTMAVALALPLGVPLARLAARRLRALMDEADPSPHSEISADG